jgi:hypothetical protein
MGELFIRKASGEEITFHRDGSKTIHMTSERCDKCEMKKPFALGKYIEQEGEKLMWICAECR